MSLNLSPEIENIVRERAAAEGVSVNDLLARTFALEKNTMQPGNDAKTKVQALLARWQAEDNTPHIPPVPIRPGETPTQALFRKWEEEDANLTEEEIEAEERLWEEFQQGINATRTALGMRPLF